jgi:group I intron endonuclease
MEELQKEANLVQGKQWCVYMHVNKINNKKYIGQTCQNPKARWANGLGYIESPRFYNAIKKYGWDNFDHIIIQQNLTLEDANALEEFLIKKFNTTSSEHGYNLQSGGMNKLHSTETKKKMSNAHRGKLRSKESKKKMSVAKKDKYIGKNNPKAHPTVQLTQNNVLIKYWDCIQEAADYYGVNEASIRGCCNGKQKTSCGFKWMYKEDYEEWTKSNVL